MKNLIAALIILVFLPGCAQPAQTVVVPTATQPLPTTAPTVTLVPTPAPSETPMAIRSFKVIAYLTSAIVPEVIPYTRLTHINFAFLLPKADGTFAAFTDEWKLQRIVALAHQQNVKVLISVGGWGQEKPFAVLAADPGLRQAFASNLSAFVEKNNLDGADIDWEYPAAGQQGQDFLALVTALRQAMPAKLLSTAVVVAGQNAEGIPAETFALFDYFNVMAYDGPDHGSMDQFVSGLKYWRGRGIPTDKIVIGIPFYARPSETSYQKIIKTDPTAAYLDTITLSGAVNRYNGIPTVQAKTRLALESAGGVMFWTLDADAPGDLSLLKAIDETIHPKE